MKAFRLIALIFLTMIFASQAWAIPVRIDFSGTLDTGGSTSSDNPSLGSDGPYSVDDPFSGYAIYESSSPATSTGGTSSYHEGAVTEFSVTFDGLGTVYWDENLISNIWVQYDYANITDSYSDRLSLGTLNNATGINAHAGTADLLSFVSAYDNPSTSGFPDYTSTWTVYSLGLSIYGGDLTIGELPSGFYDHSTPLYPVDRFSIGYFTNYINSDENYMGLATGIYGDLDSVEFSSTIDPVDPVPEPATILLFGSGLACLAGFRRRFKKV